MTQVEVAPQGVERSTGPMLRMDIQALRALAVGSVVVFHFWPHALPGGYVGVDVFFVISGFLITSHLLAELRSTGRIRLAAFWARRAKRLLPASLTVLATTAVAVLLVTPQPLQRDFLAKILAATLYFENWALAHDAVDYQASDAATTPTQHFWSLSVEEQFYVALPLLLLLVALLTRRAPRARTAVAAAVLAALTAGSLGYAVWYLHESPSQAYFSTGTRAWEFLAGGLLAFVPAVRPRLLAEALAWTGLAAIVVACVVYSDSTPFPGWPALLPVVGAAAAIRAGGRGLSALGRCWPVAWLGEVSYAAYLWHWPLVILLPQAMGHPLRPVDQVAAIALTVSLAHFSTKLLEEPVRFSPRLLGGGRRPITVLLSCGVAMAVVVGITSTASARLRAEDRQEAAAAKKVVEKDPRCLGAQSMDPAYAPCVNPDLDGVLVPTPAIAAEDDANRDECWGTVDGEANVCTLVDPPGATRHLLALGDSHNNTLLDAYAAIGEAEGWRIDAAGERGCYLTTADQLGRDADTVRDCADWNRSVIARAGAGDVDGVIVTHMSRGGIRPARGQSLLEATVEGLVGAWRKLPDVPIVAIRDNPVMTPEIVTCVEEAGALAATRCAVPRDLALRDDGQRAAAEQVPNAHVVDLSDFYCTEICSPVIGHVLVYRDRTHITRTWARTLTPYLRARMAAALAAGS